MSAIAKVTAAHTRHVPSAEVTSAETAHVASAEAADVTSAEAAHMASATTTSVSSAAAAAGLRISGKKAAGKHCTCQNHHHSSSHDISFGMGGTFRHRALSDAGVSEEGKRQRRDGLKMGILICRLH